MRTQWGLMHKTNPFRIPVNKQGLIDYQGVFKLVHGTLRYPIGTLDSLTVQEVSWLIEQSEVEKMDYYEMVGYSVKTAMISVMNGKDIKMFGDNEEEEDKKKITKEQREIELELINKKFNENL